MDEYPSGMDNKCVEGPNDEARGTLVVDSVLAITARTGLQVTEILNE